jgi:hypothetical protein
MIIRFSLVAVTSILFFAACKQQTARSGDRKFYTAVEYTDFISDQQNAIIKRMLKLTDTYDTGTPAEIKTQFDSLVKQSDISLSEIRRLTDYEGDTMLKLDAERLFEFYNHIFHNEYRKMVDIFLKGAEASEEDVAELNRIVKDVRLRESALNASLSKSQVEFSKKFGFEFLDNSAGIQETP